MTDSRREELLREKLSEMSIFEEELYNRGLELIAGVDEVGRGCLAGPVVSAAVILPKNHGILGIDDSKKLSEKRRLELAKAIKEKAVCSSIGMVGNTVIDKVNILEATKMAMNGALANLNDKVNRKYGKDIDWILIDALTLEDVPIGQTGIVKGDGKSVSIAAASILAKVTRDKLMIELSEKYPHYKLEKNKGYGTKEHYNGIEEHGVCEIHRITFLKKYFENIDRSSG